MNAKELGKQLAKESYQKRERIEYKPKDLEEYEGIVNGLNWIMEQHEEGEGYLEMSGEGWSVRLLD